MQIFIVFPLKLSQIERKVISRWPNIFSTEDDSLSNAKMSMFQYFRIHLCNTLVQWESLCAKKYVSRYMPFDGSSVDVRIECSKKFDHKPVNVNAYLAYIIFSKDNFYQLSVWDTFNAVTMFENYPSQ